MPRAGVLGLVLGLAATRNAVAAMTAGSLFTNFVSATFSLRTGAPGPDTIPGLDPVNIPNGATAWVFTTDNPGLCMQIFKTAGASTALPGDQVWFTVSYSNCGFASAVSVTLTDIFPCRAIKSGQPTSVWGQTGVPSQTWATSLGGPWNTTAPAGLTCPLYLRWILPTVSPHKTGYVKYAITIQ